MRRVAFGLGLLLTACVVNHAAFAQAAPTKTWLGIAAGPPASTETMLAADIARLFPQGSAIHALPMLGDLGARPGLSTLVSGDKQEALFKQFIEWRRAKER